MKWPLIVVMLLQGGMLNCTATAQCDDNQLLFGPTFRLLEGESIPTFAVGDVNGDGFPELFVGRSGIPDPIVWFENQGDGTFGDPVNFGLFGEVLTLMLWDADVDGDLDLIIQHENIPLMELHWNISGTIEPGGPSVWLGHELRYPTVMDIDGDGVTEIVGTAAVGQGDTALKIYRMTDSNVWAQQTIMLPASVSGLGTRPSRIADVNGDGVHDVVFTRNQSGQGQLHIFPGLGVLQFGPEILVAYEHEGRRVDVADLDQDGHPDIAIGLRGYKIGKIGVLYGLGDFKFEDLDLYPFGGLASDIEIADINDDGLLDIATIAELITFAGISYGNGTRNRGPATQHAFGVVPRDLQVVDVDGNGSLDLIGYDWWDGEINYRLNRCDRCAADFDDSGVIDTDDLLQLIAAWGVCGDDCPEDVDVDGVVGVNDLLILLGAWGTCF